MSISPHALVVASSIVNPPQCDLRRRPLIHTLVPLYAFNERPASAESLPLLTGVGCLGTALSSRELADRVAAAHAKLKGMSALQARQALIKLCKVC